MIEPSPSADSVAAVADSRPPQKKKRAQHKSSPKSPIHISSNGRPSSRDHDAGPRPIPVIPITQPNYEDVSPSNAAHQPYSTDTILFGHARPSPGRAVVTVLVANTDEHGFTTCTTSTSDTVPRTVSTDWLDRPFVFPPRKLIAHPQHGGQPLPGHRAPMPMHGQQFRRPPPPMHPHHNQGPYPGNRAPPQYVNTARGPAPFHHNNHGQNGFYPQQHRPQTRMVAPPAARFHPYNQALSHRVHASDPPPPDFRVVDSAPIRFDPYGKDCV